MATKRSNEVIEPFPQGAVARKGQFQMVFSPQLNVPGAIDLLTSAGDRLRSTPVGLAYHDAATEKAVLIAVIKDSLGELLPPNQVLYTDSFSNLLADRGQELEGRSCQGEYFLGSEQLSKDHYRNNSAVWGFSG